MSLTLKEIIKYSIVVGMGASFAGIMYSLPSVEDVVMRQVNKHQPIIINKANISAHYFDEHSPNTPELEEAYFDRVEELNSKAALNGPDYLIGMNGRRIPIPVWVPELDGIPCDH